MDLVRSSSMVKMEFEAAEALAGLAQVPPSKSVSNRCESVAERTNDDSEVYCSPKRSRNSYEETTNFMVKKSEKSGILTTKSVKDEHITELRLNPVYPTNCASDGRKSRKNLTAAEMEARKMRRVLANRESARQTIRRRQAVFVELTRKAVDLAWENRKLKREKDIATKRYDSLKAKNECLKAQTEIMNNEAKETREESITTNEPTQSASSTNSPLLSYINPSYLPFVWPNSIQLQCGPPARIVLPSHIPISSANANQPDSPYTSGTPLYLLPYPWLLTLPQTNPENRANSVNTDDMPKESSECQQFFPEKVKSEQPTNGCLTLTPAGGGGGGATSHAVSCEELLIEHDDNTNTTADHNQQVVPEFHQVPVVCSGKRLGDPAAATEARKRRKQLTRLKNHFHFRQLRK